MRNGARKLKDLYVDRAAPPAVKRSGSDETVDPSGSNVDGEHDAADGVEGRRPRSRPPRRRGPKTAAGKARVSFNALTHGISSTRLVDGDAIKAASPHLMDKVHALQDSCGADIGEPGKPMPKAAKTYSGDSSTKAWQPSVAALAGHPWKATAKAHGGAIRFAHPDKPGREDRRHASELDAGRQLKARALSDLLQHVRQIRVAQIHRELSIAQCDDRSQS